MYIDKSHPGVYLIYAFVGAILFTLIYHVSLIKNYKISAFIPTIPILGLFGLFLSIINKCNHILYIKNHIKFLLITTILYLSILFFNYFLNYSLNISLFFSIIIWLFIHIFNLYF
jgi:uncharacterized membrane protein (GlpM family)